MRNVSVRIVLPIIRWQKCRVFSQAADAMSRVSSAQRPVNNAKESGDKTENAGDSNYHLVIVGGGMVGAAVGCGLASSPLTRSLRVAIIDGNPATVQKYNTKQDPVPDARVSAITPATIRFLKDVGAWETTQGCRHAPFDSMQVWDYSGRGFTRYRAADVGEPVLGYVVENNLLISALNDALEVELFLESFLEYGVTPKTHKSDLGEVNPDYPHFTGFVFKLQANMDPKHRDKVAFVRVCSGNNHQNTSCLMFLSALHWLKSLDSRRSERSSSTVASLYKSCKQLLQDI